jgi:peptidoglycan/LPS O-acetylase OafA/YrhL
MAASFTAERLRPIDGLRGIACLLVVVFHLRDLTGHFALPLAGLAGGFLAPATLWNYGYSGVDLFFVLSGFCLSYPLMANREKPISWTRFAINRIRRIVPPYWASLLIVGLLSWAVWKLNLQSISALNAIPWPNPSLRDMATWVSLYAYGLVWSWWTLPLEWRWYFVFPFLLLIARRYRSGWILLAAVAAGAVTYGAFHFLPASAIPRAEAALTDMPLYLVEFALGIIAADISTRRSPGQLDRLLVRYLLPLVIAMSVVVLIARPQFEDPVTRSLTWGPLYFLIVLAAVIKTRAANIFGWTPIVLVGAFSYSLYLMHEVVIRVAYAWAGPFGWPAPVQALFYLTVVGPACLLFSYAFFLVAEQPWLRKPQPAPRPEPIERQGPGPAEDPITQSVVG